jgi:probable F420-dependent oxidoreductase
VTKQSAVRVAIQIAPERGDYPAIRRTASEAETLGVDAIFNWDHFFPLGKDRTGKHFECWTMLGAWAEQTERVEFGALVTGGGYRNPELLATMAQTIDHISGGRFILGIGAGWFQRDYDEYGYEFGTPGSRLKLLAEYLDRIEARFARLDPPPTREIPILIGGGGVKKTLRQVAEHGDIWHSFSDLETYLRKVAILAEHCAAVGRDPAEIEHSTDIGRIEETAANALADSGVSLFTIGVGGPDYDVDEVLAKWAAWRDARNAG